MRNLLVPHNKRGSRDVEAATADESLPVTSASTAEPVDFTKNTCHISESKDKHSDVHEAASHHTPANGDAQSDTNQWLPFLATASDSSPRLLSGEENDRINRKIDRLMAAIQDRRPIHFAPNVQTGEVDVFADHHIEVNDHDEHNPDDEYDIEQEIAAHPSNFDRIIQFGDRTRRIRSPHSLRYASSTDSWTSTESRRSSSNAWERAVAAADVRFALEHGNVSQEDTVFKKPFRGSHMESEAPRGRRLVRSVSPIPLDYNKPLRWSTPSVYSNGTEQDTSSPLFEKSCQRVLREAYSEPPRATFQREGSETSHLNERTFASEPRDEPAREAIESNAPSTPNRAFGVFTDVSNPEHSSKDPDRPTSRSKALKDVSNLRRPGYLQFNSFAKDADQSNDQKGLVLPPREFSIGFGGAADTAARRAYINEKWPGLLGDDGNGGVAGLSRLDGVARRRNEQAIDRPIDTSHYALSHMRTSAADSSLNSDPVRQAHFDLALARLEGRALPPPQSPIRRHPDWAALSDRDIRVEGSSRPLPIRGPRPSNPGPRRPFWRY